MATIFSKIAAGEIPSYKCAEDDKFYAFLDINPVKQGHTLVVPRKEIDYIFDMSDEESLPRRWPLPCATLSPARKWRRSCWASK